MNAIMLKQHKKAQIAIRGFRMNVCEIIKDICQKQGRTVTWLSGELGKNYRTVAQTLSREGMTVTSMLMMCRALGYRVVITRDKALGGYEVEGGYTPEENTNPYSTDSIAQLKDDAFELLKRIQELENGRKGEKGRRVSACEEHSDKDLRQSL